MKSNLKTIVMWLIVGIICLILISAIMENSETKMSYDELIGAINNGGVESIELQADGNKAYVPKRYVDNVMASVRKYLR